MSIYLLGIVFAIITSLIVKKISFKGVSDQFVMELPPYRIPTLRNALIHMWDKSVQYIKKMGTVILLATIIIWALEYFPQHSPEIERYTAQIEQVEADTSLTPDLKAEQLKTLELDRTACQTENSYIARIGKFIAPVFRPLGFDWKMSVSLLTGVAAKEIVVSSMGVLYHADMDADENSKPLQASLKVQTWKEGKYAGQPVFTPLVAYGYMIFILLYFPCVAALSAVFREGGRKWGIFSIFYNTSVAWLAAFLIHTIGMLF
jgi:ferrous iron transport protein B